jgi:ABC-type dipeptide/oligopeptide/nickel transport system permease component
VLPAGSTPQEIQRLTSEYGLDRPIFEQYGWFLFTFLPGLTLLAIYATLGQKGRDFQQNILAKILIVVMLVTNTVTMLNFFVTAHGSLQDSLAAFVTALVVAGLALANFAFLLVVWNGYKWGVWAFGINSFVLCTLKFVGLTPIFPVLFEFSAIIILVYLIRSSWNEMD